MIRSDIDPPTTARAYKSKTTARYSQPALVHKQVISDTHFGWGASSFTLYQQPLEGGTLRRLFRLHSTRSGLLTVTR